MRTHRFLIAVLSTALLGVRRRRLRQTTTSRARAAARLPAERDLKGSIAIDGSSTVYPFAQAAAELFNEENPDVKISVGQSGTGGGFEKFCAGETDISDASRPIKDDEEVPVCEKGGVKYSEVQIANDGIAVATNKELKVDCLTVAQLKQVWNKGSKIKILKDVDPSLPDTELSLYGPGHRLRHLRLLHRRDQRRGRRDPRGLRGLRGRQPARHRRLRRQGRPRLLRLLLLRAEPGQAEPGRRRRGRGQLRQAELRDDPGRLLQAALAPAVHVPQREGHRSGPR